MSIYKRNINIIIYALLLLFSYISDHQYQAFKHIIASQTHHPLSLLSSTYPISSTTRSYNHKLENDDYESNSVTTSSSRAYTRAVSDEPLYSISYDPLENPNQQTISRMFLILSIYKFYFKFHYFLKFMNHSMLGDLEDFLMQRSLRFLDKGLLRTEREVCYLVGLDDRSEHSSIPNE